MYTGPVTITGVPEPLPHNPVPFLSKGLGGHSGQGHKNMGTHVPLPVPRLPHLGLYGCNCWDPLPTATLITLIH